MLTEKVFDANGVSIHYAEGPANEFPLVLLHGGTLRWQHFLPILPTLSFRYHVYAVDLRGHGQSSRTPGAYRNIDYAEDVARFLHECVGRPVALLGFSLGGSVAIRVAAQEAALVHALLLVEPALYGAFSGEFPKEVLAVWRTVAAMAETSPEKMSLLATHMPNADAASLRARSKDFSQLDLDTLISLETGRIGEGFDIDASLSKLVCPVLLLQGNPALGGLEESEVERALSFISSATHVYLPEFGHNLHTPQPIAFCQIVMNFLESL